ncbi:MAG: 3-deoxy-manno-octulosonate cytidylyltransferase [Candidatus Hydrogenedentota bacterium]|nr:MAG: 3-deoxy-manno-octulosonate cytidylyltransferase [Candidatus Hydrogenedentota bacterium]
MSFSVLGVIPARLASTRFPKKALIDIQGKTMIRRVYERAQLANCFDKVIVATDSEEIYDEVVRFDGNVVMTSPTHNSGTERVIEVAEKMPLYSAYVNIQGDEPLLDVGTVRGVVDLLKQGASVATACFPFHNADDYSDPNQVKVVMDKNKRALYFSRSPIPYFRDHFEYGIAYKHIGIYGYSRNTLMQLKSLPSPEIEHAEKLEQLKFLYNGIPVFLHIATQDSIGVDTPDDLKKVLLMLKEENG